MAQEGERPRFLPPTANPPDYRGAALPAPGPRPAVGGRARTPAPSHPPRAPGRNYSTADPGLPSARSDEVAPPAVPEPSNPLAVWSISLGTIGLLLLLISLGMIVVNLPLSIAAWITGARARERPGQAPMAQAGMVTGIVGTALGTLALVLWAVGAALSV